MKERAEKFDVFTYQISPEKTNLFNLDDIEDDLIANKNKYFNELFSKNLSFFHRRNKLNYKIEYIDSEFILLRLANKKSIKVEKQFHEKIEHIEPSCLVAFFNDPEVQMIAIESDQSSFGTSFTVLNILEKTIDKELAEHQLRFYPQPKYEAKILWDLFSKYEGRIEKVSFEFSKPNLSRVNKTLSRELKDVSKGINSAKTKLEFDAPKGNSLENLNESNEYISDLVTASSEGAGPSKIKVSGITGWTTTENSVKSFTINSIEVESDKKTIGKFVEQLKKILNGE